MADFVDGELANKKVISVSCGEHHTVCATEDGSVYSWGRGKLGALGHGTADDLSMPKKIEGLSNI